MTVPAYQIVILIAYSKICQIEDFAKLSKCTGMDFKLKRAWLYVEVMGFFVNMLQLMLYLL